MLYPWIVCDTCSHVTPVSSVSIHHSVETFGFHFHLSILYVTIILHYLLSLPWFGNAYEETSRVSVSMVDELSSIAIVGCNLDSNPLYFHNLFPSTPFPSIWQSRDGSTMSIWTCKEWDIKNWTKIILVSWENRMGLFLVNI